MKRTSMPDGTIGIVEREKRRRSQSPAAEPDRRPTGHVPDHLKVVDREAEARERRREYVDRHIFESDERPFRPALIDV
jgi:hypothetical protein